MCNETKVVKEDGRFINTQIKVYLSDAAISDIDGIVTMGGGASAVYGYLVEKGAISAVISSGVAVAIAGIVAVYMGAIKINNEGCGVVLTQRLPLGNAAPTVSPQ